MSWDPEVIVISGYRLPAEIWKKAMLYCEQHQNDPEAHIPEDWEDYFINMDYIHETHDVYFGAIIHSITEGTPTIEFDTILADFNTIHRVQDAFFNICYPIYMQKGFPLPFYNKYIGMRWI